MNSISLQNVLPSVFSDVEDLKSDVWNSDISLKKGTSYLIDAESGKGKSTFCSYIYGLRTDHTGDILFDGQSSGQLNPREWDNLHRNNISYLFQDLSLFGELTSLENVVLKTRLTNCKSLPEIEEMFRTLGIEDKINVRISKMSLGQQQRVAIIRCLCQPFDFLLLDEPISHLDDRNAEIVAGLIYREAQKRGAAIVVTSIGKNLPLDYDQTIAL